MKTLPDRPDMGQLRRQAKELLAGLRSADPTTTLARAQTALADRYGFGSWTELKAEVDRRSGPGAEVDPGTARELATRFGLGELVGPMTSLAPPDETGRRFAVATERGRYEARTLDTWWPIVEVDAVARIQRAAGAAGVILPTPVPGVGGGLVEEVGGHRWWVHEHVPAGPPLVAPVSAGVAAQVGDVLAALHGLALPVDRVSPWHAGRLRPTPWKDVLAAARDDGASWTTALGDAAPALAELEALGSAAVPERPVLSHNTLGPGQCRLRADGRLVVAAWEHAGGQPPSWELADALVSWAVDPGGAVNDAAAAALTEGYRARAGGLPALDLAAFRGSATGLLNYLDGLAGEVLAGHAGPGSDVDRSVAHLLTHLPTPRTYERLLDAVTAVGGAA
ncbi:phosphotransferase [Isoptericola sp. NPDC019482]|uniref:phosphotransferase n=1 Tax=Isoptericola sp. NPDC019482 TaxID=3154688 RepID=UPI0034726703